MKIGFHSPLPPAHTGVADYSASLLRALRALGPVELFPARADVHLYHVANNILHWDIYRRALEEPGIVVLHDALLQHMFMGALDEAAYVEEFVFNYGAWARDLALDLWRGKASSGLRPTYYQYPMLKRLAERSLAVIVHNPAAARIVRQHAPDAQVVEIPHLYTEPPRLTERRLAQFRVWNFRLFTGVETRDDGFKGFPESSSGAPQHRLPARGRIRLPRPRFRHRASAAPAGRDSPRSPAGRPFLERRRGYRRLHQSPLSHRRRDFGDHRPLHGNGQAGDRFEWRRERAISRFGLFAGGYGFWRKRRC